MRRSYLVRFLFTIIILFWVFAGCSGFREVRRTAEVQETGPVASEEALHVESSIHLADVVAVTVSGKPNAYQFSVEISSPDTGCDQYADWWEVISEQGELIYRRVLLHSHANEQPFTRSGGPVAVEASTVVWVRAHMNDRGYGGSAFKGSADRGFLQATLPPDFALHLEQSQPLPDDCAF